MGKDFGFGAATSAWFTEEFGEPTAAQAGAWRTIAGGEHTLVVAPTGSGKTLAAFLWALDRLHHEPRPADRLARCRVLYVSPLKALAYDVDRNLRRPLAGITEAASRLGVSVPEVSVAMRTGDTTAEQRRAFSRAPSDVLITTPESLYLLLTSAAREALRGVETVIVDEVHAVSGTKRGAHLALSLERLDAVLRRPAQRVGLSATVRPIEATAAFLGGAAPVTVVDPPSTKTIEVAVEVTVDDMADLADVDEYGQPSIWPSVTDRLYDLITTHRSTIVFANSRLLTERLCARINEKAAGSPRIDRVSPAHIMAQSEASAGVPATLARAHHGSMSRLERLEVEQSLKDGTLAAVVATSSLELGIDMGAVDLVVQVGAPPSAASGLQRVGRAGHQVGAVSRGVVLPTHRADLLCSAVTAQRMRAGELEPMRPPRNPLDVLAQQVIAMVATDDWQVAELLALVRRAAPFASLTADDLGAVLDMLSGRYPSTGFSGLRPKMVWDRRRDVLSARKGARQLAVLNAGTIPDRGLYGVFLTDGGAGSRVGELDEEMVYESRVGDVFVLGATSWRIDSITPDRVLVTPAPGEAARMPFWKGEDPGRPAELGLAIGRALRDDGQAIIDTAGDGRARGNLAAYLATQREQTGRLPDDRTIVVERFRDELGDWRIVIHCVLGARVNRPWALAIAARLRSRLGIDAHALATDDGIVVRVPDMEHPPDGDVVRFDADHIGDVVREELAASPLFSARFRECAARALLLPRRAIGRRQPLWQQRQRASQLFAVASDFDGFPITAEAARECLEDYFDIPALRTLMAGMASREVTTYDVATERASVFAQSILTTYTAANLYGEDEPMAERKIAALNSGLLDSLLGEGEQPWNTDVAAEAEAWLQWRDGRALTDADDVAELLRVIGDQSPNELAERGVDTEVVRELLAAGRAITVTIANEDRLILAEDATRYRDGVGSTLPSSLPESLTAPAPNALADLVSRYARTRSPFSTIDCATRFGVNTVHIESTLRELAASGIVGFGHFGEADLWCATETLRLVRRRTLAALRAEIAPVPPSRYVALLSAWQLVGTAGRGGEAVAEVFDRLQGTAMPVSAIESLVLPARVTEYSPVLLDELTASGELLWAGTGSLPGGDGWVSFAYAETAPLLLPLPDETILESPLHQRVLDELDGASFFRDLTERVSVDESDLLAALWDLVWAGWASNDSVAPLRARLNRRPQRGEPRSRRRPSRLGRYGVAGRVTRAAPPEAAGRWFRLPERDTDPTRRAHAAAASLLDRDGLVVRGSVAGRSSGFAGLYPVLAAMEQRGLTRRGYFVDGLGAAQFGEPGSVDRLRGAADQPTVALSACDPASPYGLALAWPTHGGDPGHRPGRKAGAVVVLSGGELVWYLERGAKTLLTFGSGDPEAAAVALADAARRGALASATLTHIDGEPVTTSPLASALTRAGFRATPQGLRW
ncbi:DEAD/DEAH box helicase [Stackebrandtia soli]|uniref:DEAD/DEAH box helicase n=1 Tax=Stackebrandtia soli TaxID=1892856 RepID=UPI0039E85041